MAYSIGGCIYTQPHIVPNSTVTFGMGPIQSLTLIPIGSEEKTSDEHPHHSMHFFRSPSEAYAGDVDTVACKICNCKISCGYHCYKNTNCRFDLCNACMFKTAIVVSPIDSTLISERESRLDTNVMTLYHQTDLMAWESIIASGYKMKPGARGLAGPGVYFATSKADTHLKALHKGVILTCLVRLGRIKRISPYGDSSIRYHQLLREGYDSVYFPREGSRSGVELVVYSSVQVTIVDFEVASMYY